MNCPNCGNNLVDGAAFCNHCGTPIAAPAQTSAPAGTPVTPTADPYQQQLAYGQQSVYRQQPAYGQPAVPANSKSKVAAGLLGIFLGALGIHKFYMGYTKAGIIMLLVSLLTLGIGAIVMEIIGLIEGIMYLTKTDQDFYQIYVLGEKQWF